MSDTIDYGSLMHRAMRGLIQTVLRNISKNGLPGDHHFFITFYMPHPDVEIADWLADQYPEEMTIVVQNWFENLEVTDEGFSITLNFRDTPEPMFIPYDAILTFVDPSVEFGLRFEAQNGEDEDLHDDDPIVQEHPSNTDGDEPEPDDTDRKDAEVVSLDSFRR